MKKSSLITLALASLVGLVGCNQQPAAPAEDPRPIHQQMIEDFVGGVFGESSLEDIEETEAVAIFKYSLGWGDYPGYDFVGQFFTVKDAEDFFTAESFYNELYGEDEQGHYLMEEYELYYEEKAEKENEKFGDSGRTEFAVQASDYSAQYEQGFALYHYDSLNMKSSTEYDYTQYYFGLFFYNYTPVTKASLMEEYAEELAAGTITEADIDEYLAELAANFKADETGAFPNVVVICGTAITEDIHKPAK